MGSCQTWTFHYKYLQKIVPVIICKLLQQVLMRKENLKFERYMYHSHPQNQRMLFVQWGKCTGFSNMFHMNWVTVHSHHYHTVEKDLSMFATIHMQSSNWKKKEELCTFCLSFDFTSFHCVVDF